MNDEKMSMAVERAVKNVRAAGERYTKFLKMYLPGENNFYRVDEDQNQNFEKIDGALENAQRMAIDLFSKKQDKQDFNLLTDAKTVVGAINEVDEKINNLDFEEVYADGLAGEVVGTFPLSQATENKVYKVPGINNYVVCVERYNGSQISLPNENFESLNVQTNNEDLKNIIEVNGINRGLIFKLEVVSAIKGVVKFEKPFPNACIGVIPIDSNADAGYVRAISVTTEKTTRFQFEIVTNADVATFCYLAIGY